MKIQSNDAERINLLSHIIGWGLIYLTPVILVYLISGNFPPPIATYRYFIAITSLLAIFYANYLYLIDQYLFKSRVWFFILYNILLLFCVDITSRLIDTLFVSPPDIDMSVKNILDSTPVKISLIVSKFSLQLLVVLISISIKGSLRVVKEEHKRQALEKEKIEAELKNLKNKLNPHFLFNALNNIYALTAYDSEKAQFAIEKLSKLLRYVLYENDSDLVPLKNELEFTRCYIDLMALRIDPSNTKLYVDIQDISEGDDAIATLLLMTLIENSFKHGVSTIEKSFITIYIRCYESSGTKQLEAVITNSLFPKDQNDKSGSGIGLNNLKQRLDLHYKDEYTYKVDITDSGYKVTLAVPLRKVNKPELKA